ncbi:sulfatase [Thalassoglobus sp. JC818]|uniref:sulfatase n=1 Tax=Thalassoglobus sp. JC818 TaxID=3232136 RepID=UPI00345756E9
MNSKYSTKLLFGLVMSLCSFMLSVATAEEKPNVVFILIDDLGWNDLGCMGSDYYQTPNIDRLADRGVRFTNAYSACAVCSPTRAAILTGKYPARLLLTQWLPSGRWDREHNKMIEGRYIGELPLEEITVAEALRESGYATGYIGKWHLGTEAFYYPQHQGFDVNIAGRDYGAPGSYFYPFEGTWKIPSTGQVQVKPAPISGKEGDYLVDRLAEEAEQFIRSHSEKPFFLMLAHYAVHAPLQGKAEKVETYESVDPDNRQGNPKYAAMVESVDESVGRVLATLEELNLDSRTLVIFTSDNGGFAKATDNTPLRANKGSHYEGGIRIPAIVAWPPGQKNGSVCDVPVISTDWYPTILEATNTPLRPFQHLDGKSLLPLIESRSEKLDRQAIFWHYPHYNQHPQNFPCTIVRRGDWKLIENLETGEFELYNLNEDLGESNNLLKSNPQVASELQALLSSWKIEVGADPMRPNPEYQEPTKSKK